MKLGRQRSVRKKMQHSYGFVHWLFVIVCLVHVVSCGSIPSHGGRYESMAIATDSPIASEAGLAILNQGGNAVDAAVAASFCLAVTRPQSCGLGGGGFMLIAAPDFAADRSARAKKVLLQAGFENALLKTDTGTTFVGLNYRERAPGALNPAYYSDLDSQIEHPSRYGPHAIGVPGTVAGLLLAHEAFGQLPLSEVLQPAITAAENGFSADKHLALAVQETAKQRAKDPDLMPISGQLWQSLAKNGQLRRGTQIRQPSLAQTLRMIAKNGRDAFYDGPIGISLVDTISKLGGTMTLEDLKSYRVSVVEPLVSRVVFQKYTMLSMPPPSSGGIAMQQILSVLDMYVERHGLPPRRSPRYVHTMTEAMKHAFADRSRWLADPEFAPVPVDRLTDRAYHRRLTDQVERVTTREPSAYGMRRALPDDRGTSHISVVDQQGMAVACTETINGYFGSLVLDEKTGIVLNNEMDDFTTVSGGSNLFELRQSDWNFPESGKRPLSSMSPTIVLSDGRPVIVAGASGGPRIITGTLQVILDVMLFGMTPWDAVASPRFHHQWYPDELRFDESWANDGLVQAMEARGHTISEIRTVGIVQIVVVDEDGLSAASDPRKEGRPAGDAIVKKAKPNPIK